MATHISYNLDYTEDSTWQVISATGFAKASLVYTTDIGNFYSRQNYFTDREGLNSFLVKLTLSGEGYLNYNNQSYILRPGQFFWIDCLCPQDYGTSKAYGSWHVIWLHFAGGASRAYYNLFQKNTGSEPVATLPLNSPVLNLIQELDELYASPREQLDKDIYASGLITQLMISLITASAASSENIPAVIQEIRSYLLTHYTEKITLAGLSAQFNLNQFYLQKQFKRYTGQSPTEYVIYLRLKHAKELMLTSPLSISEISYAVGIENTSHFTRQFKAQEGMTPQEFRRLWPVISDKRTRK